jgi:hypothetical protein
VRKEIFVWAVDHIVSFLFFFEIEIVIKLTFRSNIKTNSTTKRSIVIFIEFLYRCTTCESYYIIASIRIQISRNTSFSVSFILFLLFFIPYSADRAVPFIIPLSTKFSVFLRACVIIICTRLYERFSVRYRA